MVNVAANIKCFSVLMPLFDADTNMLFLAGQVTPQLPMIYIILCSHLFMQCNIWVVIKSLLCTIVLLLWYREIQLFSKINSVCILQGDTMLRYLEVSTKEPFLHVCKSARRNNLWCVYQYHSRTIGMRLLYSYAIEFQSVFFAFSNLCIFIASTDTVEQAKGIALVPKLACDVMSGEVNRVLLLTKNGVIPLPYIVPRKVCCYVSSYIIPREVYAVMPRRTLCPERYILSCLNFHCALW